jgi:hypothetical protein
MDAVEVRRSRRARHWRLVVPWGEPARLTVPQRMSNGEITRVLLQSQIAGSADEVVEGAIIEVIAPIAAP